jgi:hypothetical protein
MTQRRFGPPPHQQDPYSRLTSPRGIPVDQLVSVLQKDIRRGNTDNAVLAAYEMLSTSAEVAEHLWRGLKLIAVRYLALARKDRTSSEHADLVAARVESGELRVSVPDYALCVHTRAGQEMGRGLMQWWENGALVNDEIETADHSYRDELIAVHRAAEQEDRRPT